MQRQQYMMINKALGVCVFYPRSIDKTVDLSICKDRYLPGNWQRKQKQTVYPSRQGNCLLLSFSPPSPARTLLSGAKLRSRFTVSILPRTERKTMCLSFEHLGIVSSHEPRQSHTHYRSDCSSAIYMGVSPCASESPQRDLTIVLSTKVSAEK